MANTNNHLTLENLSGMHIYTDDKGRKIYYKSRKLIGYVIQQENLKTYNVLSNRFVMTTVALILGYLLLENWKLPTWLSIFIAGAVLLFMQYRFHVKFLPNLVQAHNFVPTKKSSKIESMAKEDLWRLCVKTVLYPIFGALLLLEFYLKESSTIILFAGLCIFIVTIVLAGFSLSAIVYKKKHPELLVPQQSKKTKK